MPSVVRGSEDWPSRSGSRRALLLVIRLSTALILLLTSRGSIYETPGYGFGTLGFFAHPAVAGEPSCHGGNPWNDSRRIRRGDSWSVDHRDAQDTRHHP